MKLHAVPWEHVCWQGCKIGDQVIYHYHNQNFLISGQYKCKNQKKNTENMAHVRNPRMLVVPWTWTSCTPHIWQLSIWSHQQTHMLPVNDQYPDQEITAQKNKTVVSRRRRRVTATAVSNFPHPFACKHSQKKKIDLRVKKVDLGLWFVGD